MAGYRKAIWHIDPEIHMDTLHRQTNTDVVSVIKRNFISFRTLRSQLSSARDKNRKI